MKCPTHDANMVPKRTRFGTRWGCLVEGCTVVCWDGQTSTPADEKTRRLRHRCHEVFDPLWRFRTHFKKRSEAYKWLAHKIGLPIEKAHIGMLNAEQCRKLLALLEAIA